ncbi:hypothetical protein A6R68_00324, partial [Neotoma lepida]
EEYFFGKCFDAMEVDAFNSSHPVSTPVENPAQIREMFDDVSYVKVPVACSPDIHYQQIRLSPEVFAEDKD